MLDHVFTDAIGALRDALEQAMLERQAFEERFQSDVLLGDLTWETSYGLPGEGNPPRVRADLTLEWPTGSPLNILEDAEESIGGREAVTQVLDAKAVHRPTSEMQEHHTDPPGEC